MHRHFAADVLPADFVGAERKVHRVHPLCRVGIIDHPALDRVLDRQGVEDVVERVCT